MAERARYVYAVSAGLPPDALRGVAGIAGAPVELIGHRDLQALVSDVDLGEYGEAGLRRNLEDLGWLEETARAHDDVVRAATAAAPTAPLRLATIFLDDEGVRRCVEDLYGDLRAALQRVDGRREWSVKVVAKPRAQARASAAAPTGGADYLRRKKAESQARQSADAEALAAAERVSDAVTDGAVAVRRLPAQDPRLSGLEGEMLLNLAALVEQDAGDDLAARVHEIADAEAGVDVVVAGPWPPYSFATLETP
ncbi:GvpL/GvpF family gas vesicle protein [Nocardioides sp. DS6]|uniref:GvpL/GvpF family gas vesicle protein n=1 Tax=Nocardioides eburneus TaxID=3231482 RepID=A0ABV3T2F9_9ACTN